MREFFRFMAGRAGRWLTGILGFALLAWGYNYAGGVNITFIIVGLIPLATAVFDIYPLAPLFGYPVRGTRIREKYGAPVEPGEA
jgi:hypothetical protein